MQNKISAHFCLLNLIELQKCVYSFCSVFVAGMRETACSLCDGLWICVDMCGYGEGGGSCVCMCT